MESRIQLKLVLGGRRIVAPSVNSHEQTQPKTYNAPGHLLE